MLTKTQGWKLRKRWREANTVFFKLPAQSPLEPFMKKEPYLVKSALNIYKFVCKKHYGSWDLCSAAMRWEVPHLRKYYLLFINALPVTNLLQRQWDSQSNKGVWGCGEKQTLVHCWLEGNFLQTWCKMVEVLQNITNRTTMWSSNPASGCISKGQEITILKRFASPCSD